MLRTVLLFAALTLTACGIGPADETEGGDLATSENALSVKACISGRTTLAEGTIIVAGRGRAQCLNGTWRPMSITFGPVAPEKFDCGLKGCNCWGDDDCDKLTQSGDCNGNPITCDPNNPKACHCK